MDRRVVIAFLAAVLLLLWLGRNRLLDIITRGGGFDLEDVGEEIRELPQLQLPPAPHFRKGPEFWGQTTGLICACDMAQYTAPVIVQELEIPPAPLPRYINIPAPTTVRAAQRFTYSTFGMNSDYPIWGDRPYEQVWRGSDGRMFLQPKRGIWGEPLPNKSFSQWFIGTDEYTFKDGVIYYGPYEYHMSQMFSGTRSA